MEQHLFAQRPRRATLACLLTTAIMLVVLAGCGTHRDSSSTDAPSSAASVPSATDSMQTFSAEEIAKLAKVSVVVIFAETPVASGWGQSGRGVAAASA